MKDINEKMNPESFCYWLQGFFELSDAVSLTEKQVKIIKEHLEYVFTKGHLVTPICGEVTVTEVSQKPSNEGLGKILQEIAKHEPVRKEELGAQQKGTEKIWTGITGTGTTSVVC